MMYARDLQRCDRCDCTLPESALRKVRRVDDVLKLEEAAWVCRDEERCARLKLERAELLSAERELREHIECRLLEGAERVKKNASKYRKKVRA